MKLNQMILNDLRLDHALRSSLMTSGFTCFASKALALVLALPQELKKKERLVSCQQTKLTDLKGQLAKATLRTQVKSIIFRVFRAEW